MNIFNDTFIVKFDEETQSLLIIHPDESVMSRPVVQVRAETFDKMSFLEASQFIGERLLILIPQLQSRYAEDLEKLRNENL
jgi:hypothetical protein